MQCPGGHFIAAVGLYVFVDDGPIRMMPKHPAGVDRKRRRSPTGALPGAEHRAHWWHEYGADGKHTKVRAVCGHHKCGYVGVFDADRLAIELAVYALAGHREHRLTA